MTLYPLGSLAAFELRSEGFADYGILEFYKGLLGLSIIIDNTELILMMKGMQWSYIKVKKVQFSKTQAWRRGEGKDWCLLYKIKCIPNPTMSFPSYVYKI